jgi:hypothetical protein
MEPGLPMPLTQILNAVGSPAKVMNGAGPVSDCTAGPISGVLNPARDQAAFAKVVGSTPNAVTVSPDEGNLTVFLRIGVIAVTPCAASSSVLSTAGLPTGSMAILTSAPVAYAVLSRAFEVCVDE